jgi:hypothetical protein
VVNIDPQQEIFTAYKLALEAKGYDVYDGALPPENTPYPFIYLGDFRESDSQLKNAVVGYVYPTIHVWHNNTNQRGTVSRIVLDVKKTIMGTDKTANFGWLLQSLDSQIIPDTTTTMPLLHGIIEAGLKFS